MEEGGGENDAPCFAALARTARSPALEHGDRPLRAVLISVLRAQPPPPRADIEVLLCERWFDPQEAAQLAGQLLQMRARPRTGQPPAWAGLRAETVAALEPEPEPEPSLSAELLRFAAHLAPPDGAEHAARERTVERLRAAVASVTRWPDGVRAVRLEGFGSHSVGLVPPPAPRTRFPPCPFHGSWRWWKRSTYRTMFD